MPIVSFSTKSTASRAGIFLFLCAIIIWAFYSAKWGFANTAGTRTDLKEVTDLASSISPDDPAVRLANARLLEKTFDPGDFGRSLLEYKAAAALSPYDYGEWLSLGRALERDGDRPAAEAAYRRAAKLAPDYSRVNWALGNVLVRQRQYDEGFARIRFALENDPAFAGPAVTAAFQAYGEDLEKIETAIGDSTVAKAELVKSLAVQKELDKATKVWQSIPSVNRMESSATVGKDLVSKLLEENEFRDAVSVASDLVPEDEARPKIGSVTNGGFEKGVKLQNADPFDWQVGAGLYPQVALSDGQKKDGKYSLLMIFSAPAELQFREVKQTIAVEPGEKYRLTFAYRSELNTRAELNWLIEKAGGGDPIAKSESLVSGGEWKDAAIDFTAPTSGDGLVIRLSRSNCTAPACTVSGSLWFDSFSLSSVK